MIGSTVKILGEIISEENLIIEGEVEGTITLKDNELIIGPSGRIHANINAKNIKIDGMVDGDIVAKEKVVISKSGNVRGNLVAPRVILEDGGRFKGSIDMGPAVGASGELPIGSVEGGLNKAARTTSETAKPELNAAIKRA
jgi:cytoskeletal protein CcmA (bactofilin family)